MELTENNIPKRNVISLNNSAQLAIRNAMTEVEKLGQDKNLTNAIIYLQGVFNTVSDYIESKQKQKEKIEQINKELTNSETGKSEYTNNMKTGLTFGEALEAVKQGKLIAREGWNGKGMFVFQRPEDNLDVETIVNKVKSLPDAVKIYFSSQYAWTIKEEENGKAPMNSYVKFTAYLCMKAADNSIVNGWLASQTDMLSNDWCILD